MSEYIPYDERKDVEFATLVGLTFVSVEVSDAKDAITFTTNDGRIIKMLHWQDCCESVTVDDITGDLADLVGEPILLAEEATNSHENPAGFDVPEYQDSFTWTFYKLATRKGYVDIRWYGESNGYYSESVSLVELTKKGGAA